MIYGVGCRDVAYMLRLYFLLSYYMNLMNSIPNPTETPVAINPGIMKEWFKMYLPMRVVPVRSKLMAATTVG